MTSRIHFNPVTKVYSVPARWQMSNGETNAKRFKSSERKRRKLELMETLKAIRAGQILREEDGLCARGLEHLQSPTHLEQRNINKDFVNAAVLNEQERQRGERINIPDEIACAARYNSRWATEKALLLGLSDAMVVHQTNQTRQVIATGDALLRNSQTAKMRSSEISLLQKALVISNRSDDVSDLSYHDTNSVDYTNTPLSTALRRAKKSSSSGYAPSPTSWNKCCSIRTEKRLEFKSSQAREERKFLPV